MIMTQEEVFNHIQNDLQKYINILYTGVAMKMSKQDIEIMLKVYNFIFPGKRLNPACASCITLSLSYIASYYDREYPKYLLTKELMVEPEVITKKRKTK